VDRASPGTTRVLSSTGRPNSVAELLNGKVRRVLGGYSGLDNHGEPSAPRFQPYGIEIMHLARRTLVIRNNQFERSRVSQRMTIASIRHQHLSAMKAGIDFSQR
jgi:hypothetical protein